jgi:hypothetical protein
MRKRQSAPRRGFEILERRDLLAGDIRITEINYNPHPSLLQFGERDVEADDYEFIEVANLGDQPVNLDGYQFTQGVEFEFRRQTIQPGERLVVVQDPRDFRVRYGDGPQLAAGRGGSDQDQGEFAGNIRNSGEQIVLLDNQGNVVHAFAFFDIGEWPIRPDGGGSSLEVIDVHGNYSDPKNWRASSEFGGSPGFAGAGHIGDVVINELLTHTDLPQVDSIELFNPTNRDIDMSGWYITDSLANMFRYQIPDEKGVIPAGGYTMFDFFDLGFQFHGEEADNAYLVEPDALGKPIRFVDAVSFSATQNGVSLGRWNNGVGGLFPMTENTFEDFNSGPWIGDVVISEVHYHPPDRLENFPPEVFEFIEIHNRLDLALDIGQWQLAQAVEFTIPTGTVIEPFDQILLVGFDPATEPAKKRAFLTMYGLDENEPLLGPYSDALDPNADQLDDDGETILFQRPEDLLQLGLGYVLVDRVTYRDRGDWPTEADGHDRSLTRTQLGGYGDFPETWRALAPTPGTTGPAGDVDGNGIVEANDIDQLCLALRLGGGRDDLDLNHDGRVNEQDVRTLVKDILDTDFGDTNLDRRFDSADLVAVFAAGQYEDGIAQNSNWRTGDWNCDSEFDTRDLVVAFQDGGYRAESVPAADWAIAVRIADSERDARRLPARDLSGFPNSFES